MVSLSSFCFSPALASLGFAGAAGSDSYLKVPLRIHSDAPACAVASGDIGVSVLVRRGVAGRRRVAVVSISEASKKDCNTEVVSKRKRVNA